MVRYVTCYGLDCNGNGVFLVIRLDKAKMDKKKEREAREAGEDIGSVNN